jgi:hypothetical protein
MKQVALPAGLNMVRFGVTWVELKVKKEAI